MKKKIILTLVVLVVVLAAIFYIKKSATSVTDNKHLNNKLPIVVEVINPKEQDSYRELSLPGKTGAFEVFTIKAKSAGIIEDIPFAVGSFVEKGELLLSINTESIDNKIAIQKEIYEIKKNQTEVMKGLLDKGAASELEYYKFRLDYLDNKRKYHEFLDQKEKKYILSPTNGLVESKLASEGEHVNVRDKIATIDNIDKIRISFNMEEDDYRQFRDSEESAIQAYVQSIDKTIDIDTFESSEVSQDGSHSVHIEGIVSNVDKKLLPGLFTKVKLFFLDKTKVLLVPKQAVFMDGDEYFVYKYNDDAAKKILVNLDKSYNNDLQISSPLLKKQDQVIIASSKRLYPDAKVILEK